MADLYINPRLTIPSAELRISTARSSGPGGQNVNKVNSKVTLKWSPRECALLGSAWRQRILARYGGRINTDGYLVLHGDRYRDQPRNLADVRQRLAEMLRSCQAPPKTRKLTRPTRGSQRRRLDQKNQQAEKKKLRRRPRFDD